MLLQLLGVSQVLFHHLEFYFLLIPAVGTYLVDKVLEDELVFPDVRGQLNLQQHRQLMQTLPKKELLRLILLKRLLILFVHRLQVLVVLNSLFFDHLFQLNSHVHSSLELVVQQTVFLPQFLILTLDFFDAFLQVILSTLQLIKELCIFLVGKVFLVMYLNLTTEFMKSLLK